MNEDNREIELIVRYRDYWDTGERLTMEELTEEVFDDLRPRQRIKDPDALKRFRLEHLDEPCELCELRPGTDPHHVQYRSHGGDDIPENLLWLCRQCHNDLHDGRL